MLLAEDGPRIALSAMNFGPYVMVNEATRIEGRASNVPLETPFDADEALERGLVTFAPDELDWDDELRIAIEERASLSPDALTGMEASLRFGGRETMAT